MDQAITNFLNADEAAVFLGGLHARTINRWAREGYLPAYPIGEGKRRIWRYLRDDLAAWMQTRRNDRCREPYEAESNDLYTRSSHRCSYRGAPK